ncbi:Na(+)/H(+) exchange regulatory cofactor NHE-RF1-like [Brienomyrus brachyistius]|uniref:Na(+)/H(+) exchange regulatory cofactor NHE-RF1-like n=1 Tax=Brienomyrus brachyistius TaxID=42636 RepID=UPI0020B44217|nr:Na(+)/H(+) exchange regulatory cofactor NHE-RF1-like [Brienomyrus brachyistius]
MTRPRPRLCVLEKGSDGYGFHLHGEKGKSGQFIRLVEPDSPAEASGLRAGDRLVFVNGERVEGESHQQVVSRIRTTVGKLELIVVDQETEDVLKEQNLKCMKEYVTEGIPIPSDEAANDGGVEEGDIAEEPAPTPEPEENGAVLLEKKLSISSDQDTQQELRPRLCVIVKGATGYGFNLHSERSKPGQYIRAVDEDSPAQRSGLRPKDRIVQVNGDPVDGKQHGDVVEAIRSGGEETALLVVDPETDAFFKRCQVTPTEGHLTGPLPEPIANGGLENKINNDETEEANSDEGKVSVSPALSSSSSEASLSAPPTTPPSEATEAPPEEAELSAGKSLQLARERAHQKRRKAPPMDWSKKHELFHNL